MPSDYLPESDDLFSAWARQFLTRLAAVPAGTFDVSPEEFAALLAIAATWDGTLAQNRAAKIAARSARQAKLTGRKAYEAALRKLVRRLQASPAMTDAIRTSLQITVRDTRPTVRRMPPRTRPVLQVDAGQALRHVIGFRDESGAGKAKPEGVSACEIFCKIGSPPEGAVDRGSAGDMQFLTRDSATPHIASFSQEHAGKTAYYRARWIGQREEFGPWSETVAATIGG